MKYVTGYTCTVCNKTFDKTYNKLTCDVCNDIGILDVNYDYKLMKESITKEYFQKNKDFSIFRYADLMSIHKPNVELLKVGWTPLYRSDNLSKELEIEELYIKDDGLNPTGSLKDRASIVAVCKALEHNIDTICCASTGNAASSLAGNAAKANIKTVIFVPKRAPIGKLTQLNVYGASVYKVYGDYKKTYNISKEAIKKYGYYNRNAAINPHLVEGKKTVALEIAEQLNFEDIDYVFVSVGDGCTIGGVYKGFYDLYQLQLINKMPKIVGVQASNTRPFYDAFHSNQPLKEAKEDTIADSIAVGIPRNPIKGLQAVVKSKGTYVHVSDEEILDAIKILGKTEGLFSEPAAGASLAGLIKARKECIVSKEDKCVVIVTGNGLKDPNCINNDSIKEINNLEEIKE